MRQVIFLATRAVALVAFVAIAGAGLAACDSDHEDGHTHDDQLDYCGLPKSCQAIVLACHDKDDVSNAEVHECHNTAHEVGTAEACGPVEQDCITKCNAAPELDGGTHEHFECEGGSHMVEHDAAMHDSAAMHMHD